MSLVSTNALALQAKQKPSSVVRLRLLATSDLHFHILPFDYYIGESTERLGLARTASLIETARAEAENCLLFDNGDFIQGSPLGDYIACSRGVNTGDGHPMIAAMNHLRYDAGTLGNHEFNYGLDFLKTALEGTKFPIVAANLRVLGAGVADQTLVPPYVILRRVVLDEHGMPNPIKIGVIGFTPPQILIWDQRHLAGKLGTDAIVDAANEYVPKMQREGADIIIALSHSGIEMPDAAPGAENASTALARIKGIDAVIAGHSHLVFPSPDFASTNEIDPIRGTVFGKPVVMPGFNGSHLGVIDLVLMRKGGRYAVRSHKSEARPIWQRGADGKGAALVATHVGVADLIAETHRETLGWVNRPIGHTDMALHSYFSLVADAPALQLVAAAQAKHVQKQLAATPFANLPVLASVAPFKAGGRGGPENYTDVPVGDVMLRNATDLYIHPNTSAAVGMTGAEIALWLEFAAGIFNHIAPGSINMPLINPDFPSFNFDLIFGLDFQFDLAQPPRFDERGALINPQSQRVTGLSFQGVPLDPNQKFAIATNSYRVSSNGDYLPMLKDNVIYQSATTNLDVLLHHFASAPSAAAKTPLSRRFVAMPDTSVTFDTSPKALPHLADLDHLKIEPIGITPTGFLRFRLHL